jgi:hypothetical protein
MLFFVCWKIYANGHMYDDNYIMEEGRNDEYTTYEKAQEQVNNLNSASPSIFFYVGTDESFYGDMPPLVPLNAS